jgi:hypothetical protein
VKECAHAQFMLVSDLVHGSLQHVDAIAQQQLPLLQPPHRVVVPQVSVTGRLRVPYGTPRSSAVSLKQVAPGVGSNGRTKQMQS